MNQHESSRINQNEYELSWISSRFIQIYMILCRATCCHGGQSCFYSVCVWINTKYDMNEHESSRINQNEYELRWISSRFIQIYMVLCGATCCHGGQSCFYSVCVWWINSKYNMNEHESSRINQNEYELRWISYDSYEFVWYYAERRVATGGSLALQCVCVWINSKYNMN
jgi:hypothetical protein